MESRMATHEGLYEVKYPLANIDNGPGTASLEKAKLGDQFTFDGEKLVDGEYYLTLPKTLAEINRIDTHHWVLWFRTSSYPIRVERMVYDSHLRFGALEAWEKILPPRATAEDKADHADAGSTLMLPVPALWWLAIVFGVLTWIGWEYRMDSAWGVLMIFGMGAVEFAGMALYKWDRDRFWRALDTINALDLRRPPEQ
jgi:hypothetical protein